MDKRDVLVIGIGSQFRGDDAAGLYVIDLLEEQGYGAVVKRHAGDGASLMESWRGAQSVFLVDAVVSGAPPGTIHRIYGAQPLPVEWFKSTTHLMGVAEAVELARTLNRLPPALTIIGIEGREFTLGAPMTSAVAAASRCAAFDICKMLNP